MVRREFLGWLCKIGGGCSAVTFAGGMLPLRKINTVLLSEAHANGCTQDICTTSDSGGACTNRDVCDADSSDTCTNDECTADRSGKCENDNCVADDSWACTNDECVTDKSGTCTGDRCESDSSGNCINDGGPACQEDFTCSEDIVGCRTDFGGICQSDSSGGCENDSCSSDGSGDCTSDICSSDSSGGCGTDYCSADSSGTGSGDECVADSSGSCTTDWCISDKSGGCESDNCSSDSSGDCTSDKCASDSSKGCGTDKCSSDSSGECTNDECTSDSSGGCGTDLCSADSSGICTTDNCSSDSSGDGIRDTCTADASGACRVSDVCVRDFSEECNTDLCRDDRTPAGTICNSDLCVLDLAHKRPSNRRDFAKSGLNQALKMLYKLVGVVLCIGLFCGEARAIIDAGDAAFSPIPTFTTGAAVSVPSPVGPFLRDCDNDGIPEADVNGDGECTGDPELRDYDSDGNRELPNGTTFSGSFQFTCFHIPDDALIKATGPLTVMASDEFAVFGAVHLTNGGTFSCIQRIDLHTSAWLAASGALSFSTATGPPVQTDPASDLTDRVPPVSFTSICANQPPIPTLSQWGMLVLSGLMGVIAVAVIRRRKTV